jgi:hypothetical protein
MRCPAVLFVLVLGCSQSPAAPPDDTPTKRAGCAFQRGTSPKDSLGALSNFVGFEQFFTDAAAGKLPAVTFVGWSPQALCRIDATGVTYPGHTCQ